LGDFQKKLGRRGEDLVEKYLKSKGYAVLERNFHCRFGEIDIVARDGNEIVFIEVKTRRGANFGHPEEAIDPRKQKRIIRTPHHYMSELGDQYDDFRIDAAFVCVDPRGDMKIEYLSHIVPEDNEDEY
jgi:putative endonuclease